MTAEAPTLTTADAPSMAATTATNDTPPAWSFARRIAFRCVFVHFALLFFPAPITSLLPVVGEIIDDFFAHSVWLPINRIVAQFVLHLPGKLEHEVTGSGDTLFDYVHVFTSVSLAVIIACIWSIAQRDRKEHAKLEAAFRIWLRYTLAVIMLTYGAFKVVKLQFPTPSPIQLIKTYGDSSPMNLLWTFMGFSTPYTFFAGLMEILPALLLFSRRTALLGSLLLMAVLGNVVMLNFCYDVPVKLYSSHLLLMSILIALPDLKRLVQFFLQNTSTEPAPKRIPFPKRWMERTRIGAKSAFIAIVLIVQTRDTWNAAHEMGSVAQTSSLYGAHEVDSFFRDGVEVAPLLTDAHRWRYFILRGFDDKRFATFSFINGERKFFNAQIDAEKKTLTLEGPKTGEETPPKYTLQYNEPQAGILEFEGTFDGAVIRVKLHKLEPEKFLLMNRGFRWVNEVPFNR